MADMKQIFTYPNNGTTDFIEPNYHGDANSGLTRRVDELLDGTYRDWSNLDPVSDLGTINSETMQNLSKFIDYYVAKKTIQNLTFYDFWYNPMVVGTKGLIGGSSISTVVYTPGTPPAPDTTIFTTTTTHSFADSDMVILSGFNGGMTQFNGDTFYVKVLSSTTLQLAHDSALTNLFIHGSNSTGTFETFDWEVQKTPFQSGYTIDRHFKVDLTNYVPDAGQDTVQSVLDGTRMDVNTIEKNGQGLVGNSYYLKNTASPFQYEVYEDSGLTNPLNGTEITGLTTYQLPARITPKSWSTGVFMLLETENQLAGGETWVNLPLSQHTYQWTGFANQAAVQPLSPPDHIEYFNTISATDLYGNPSNAITSDGVTSTSVPTHLFFNDYYDIDLTDHLGNRLTHPRMNFVSQSYDLDPINVGTLDYKYEVLAQSTARWKTALRNLKHCLPIFDGFKFDNITRDSNLVSYNQPTSGDMVYTQDAMPVLDPETISFGFDNWGSYNNTSIKSAYSSNTYGNMTGINVVLWKPGINLDDYRMDWSDYGYLNIYEKDGSNQWTVPIWAEATCTDPWNPGNQTGSDSTWTFNSAGVGAPALIAYTNTHTDPSNSNNTRVGYMENNSGSRIPSVTNRPINYHTFNALWGTSYTANSIIDIQVSPLPHDLGTGNDVRWQANQDSSNYPYYTNSDPNATFPRQRTWGYQSTQGISTNTNYYPLVGKQPTLFQLIDEVTINPLVTGDINAELIMPANTIATAGDIAIDSNFPYPYELTSLDIILPGNETYSYQDTNNATVYASELDSTRYWSAGDSSPTLYPTTGETSPTATVAVNGSGKLQSITMLTEGRYSDADPVLIQLESPADTYIPIPPTVAELEDIWDTDDEWASDGFANKEWPDHVTPRSAVINYNSPTIVNNSQSGIKYTRSVGHTKWRLEVEYPPMSAEDFQKFHAIAQAAHGQSTPFYFNLKNKDNVSILWKDFYDQVNTTTSPLIKDAITVGDTTLLVEGFSSNETDAFKRGEVFIDGKNENGYLHTSLSGTDSNIFGEAKIRTPWPFRTSVVAGEKIYKNPSHAVVTLGSDNFEYSVDVNNYYYVSVAFDLDSWK